ncbi:hypothetical protein [Schleiferilactobacillus shenzhenensis]|uniref:Bacteriocin-associated integral membrane protein n=1 Tax=Schleiferilactobacillus shenzhenensis LY-73 TaxID=1231336 RepID=U4TR58_9LACO|nr:hypothetical protein [Schleiferilactobacillus shenzhenensis]ERL64368.1 hypothetical protein L248_1030 [Schleiferilactobacillus shenzhenensis LY-73]
MTLNRSIVRSLLVGGLTVFSFFVMTLLVSTVQNARAENEFHDYFSVEAAFPDDVNTQDTSQQLDRLRELSSKYGIVIAKKENTSRGTTTIYSSNPQWHGNSALASVTNVFYPKHDASLTSYFANHVFSGTFFIHAPGYSLAKLRTALTTQLALSPHQLKLAKSRDGQQNNLYITVVIIVASIVIAGAWLIVIANAYYGSQRFVSLLYLHGYSRRQILCAILAANQESAWLMAALTAVLGVIAKIGVPKVSGLGWGLVAVTSAGYLSVLLGIAVLLFTFRLCLTDVTQFVFRPAVQYRRLFLSTVITTLTLTSLIGIAVQFVYPPVRSAVINLSQRYTNTKVLTDYLNYPRTGPPASQSDATAVLKEITSANQFIQSSIRNKAIIFYPASDTVGRLSISLTGKQHLNPGFGQNEITVSPEYLKINPLFDTRGRRIKISPRDSVYTVLVPERYASQKDAVKRYLKTQRQFNNTVVGKEFRAKLGHATLPQDNSVHIITIRNGQPLLTFDPWLQGLQDPLINVVTAENFSMSTAVYADNFLGYTDGIFLPNKPEQNKKTIQTAGLSATFPKYTPAADYIGSMYDAQITNGYTLFAVVGLLLLLAVFLTLNGNVYYLEFSAQKLTLLQLFGWHRTGFLARIALLFSGGWLAVGAYELLTNQLGAALTLACIAALCLLLSLTTLTKGSALPHGNIHQPHHRRS